MVHIIYVVNIRRYLMTTETVKKSAVKSKTAVVPVKKITTASAKSPAVKALATEGNGKSSSAVPRIAAAKAKPSIAVKMVPRKKVAAKLVKPVAETVAPKEKIKKAKLVRDCFTMPEEEYVIFGKIKKACANAGMEVKKSQLLRVGLALMSKTNVSDLKTLIAGLAPLKVGRPMKDK